MNTIALIMLLSSIVIFAIGFFYSGYHSSIATPLQEKIDMAFMIVAEILFWLPILYWIGLGIKKLFNF
jgi:hypothetical protein